MSNIKVNKLNIKQIVSYVLFLWEKKKTTSELKYSFLGLQNREISIKSWDFKEQSIDQISNFIEINKNINLSS